MYIIKHLEIFKLKKDAIKDFYGLNDVLPGIYFKIIRREEKTGWRQTTS